MNSIFLRAMEVNDLEYTHKWHTDQQLYSTLFGTFRYVSMDAEKAWLLGKAAYSTKEVNLMICLQDNSEPIGMISVRDIDWVAKKGHLAGIMIGENRYQGQGYGTQALNLLLKHCFEDLGINKIWTHILADNEPSQIIFKKCGFRVEGRLRQHAFKNGQYTDVVHVGLCADQYKDKE